jgi:hypothetical protein
MGIMNNEEAIRILDQALQVFRDEPYNDLVNRLGTGPVVCERRGPDGVNYQIEIEFLWDGRAGGDVLVTGSTDDGGCRAFVPITRSFIKSADESFVGE